MNECLKKQTRTMQVYLFILMISKVVNWIYVNEDDNHKGMLTYFGDQWNWDLSLYSSILLLVKICANTTCLGYMLDYNSSQNILCLNFHRKHFSCLILTPIINFSDHISKHYQYEFQIRYRQALHPVLKKSCYWANINWMKNLKAEHAMQCFKVCWRYFWIF